MWKLILIAIIAFAIWKFYPSMNTTNIEKIKENTINSIKNEKTIRNVNESRQNSKDETQNALNN